MARITATRSGVALADGASVLALSRVDLSAEGSSYGDEAITAYKWHVKLPPGYHGAKFQPSDTEVAQRLYLEATGTYRFFLEVWAGDRRSCRPAELTLQAAPPADGLYVELTWDTPADPDQANEGPAAGTDAELFLLHPSGLGEGSVDVDGDGTPEGWYTPHSCFLFFRHPDWGDADPEAGDDPSLDSMDDDGAGPEAIRLPTPEALVYGVGAHLLNDHGYGSSCAYVRVFMDGALAWEQAGVELAAGDFLYAVEVDWAAREVRIPACPNIARWMRFDGGWESVEIASRECLADCVPDCAGKTCGPDGCGGTCGACGADCTCDEGQCVPFCSADLCLDGGC